MTKLVLAIINNDDSAIATSALNAEGFFVTRLSTTGGFLTVGNTTLLIGTEDGKVPYLRHAQTAQSLLAELRKGAQILFPRRRGDGRRRDAVRARRGAVREAVIL